MDILSEASRARLDFLRCVSTMRGSERIIFFFFSGTDDTEAGTRYSVGRGDGGERDGCKDGAKKENNKERERNEGRKKTSSVKVFRVLSFFFPWLLP